MPSLSSTTHSEAKLGYTNEADIVNICVIVVFIDRVQHEVRKVHYAYLFAIKLCNPILGLRNLQVLII